MVKPLIMGHRGAMGTAPENTAISFQKALNTGADGIEFDVHMSRDGHLVVIHDERIDRTTNGKGFIKDLTLEEIKEYEAGSYFDPGYSEERILTLEETLSLARDCQAINIEIKNGPIFYEGIEEKVIQTIEKFELKEKVIISSFNHYTVHKIKELDPGISCGLLYMAGLFQPWEYARKVGVEALHPFYLSINQEVIQQCQENGIMVNVFGANEPEMLGMLIKTGVDMIITDFPERGLQLRKEILGN